MEQIVLAIGILELLLSLFFYYRIKKIENWVVVKGHIIKLYIDENKSIGDDERATYRPIVEYVYRWGDEKYYSKKIYIGDSIRMSWHSFAKSQVSKFKENDTVDVYVNPLKPKVSVLVRGNYKVVWLQVFVGLIFILIYGLILLNYLSFDN